VRNLLVDPAYEVLPLLVVRARHVPAIGECLGVEGVGATRALEELVEVTCVDAEGFDQRIDLPRLEAALDKLLHEQQLVEGVDEHVQFVGNVR
jgi:hypothetical protein